MPQKVNDMTGKKYGRLTVIKRVDNDLDGNAYWLCECECGEKVKVRGAHLRSGKTKSCGCLQRDIAHINGLKNCKNIIGHTPWNKGKRKPLTYRRLKMIWYAMRQRCKNKKCQEYEHYGGRGIAVCDEWDKDFSAFYNWALENGYNNLLTIDRIDNNGGYNPANCRFVTRTEQNRNTSRTCIIYDEYNNKYTAAQVAEMIGVGRSTAAVWYRKYGFRTVKEYEAHSEELKLKK